VVTGGTWVEMDCNMPSGEAMLRQFLYVLPLSRSVCVCVFLPLSPSLSLSLSLSHSSAATASGTLHSSSASGAPSSGCQTPSDMPPRSAFFLSLSLSR
jgi:hypothetical protein